MLIVSHMDFTMLVKHVEKSINEDENGREINENTITLDAEDGANTKEAYHKLKLVMEDFITLCQKHDNPVPEKCEYCGRYCFEDVDGHPYLVSNGCPTFDYYKDYDGWE